MSISSVIKGMNTELYILSQIGGIGLDAHGKARNMPRNPFESDTDYRNRIQRKIRDEMFDQSQAEQATAPADAEIAKISADVAEIETGYGEEKRPSFYAEVRPDGQTGVSFAQAMADLQGASFLAGEDLDRLAQRYGIERDGAEADYWFRVRIQRAASGIIQNARHWMQEPMEGMATPSGREVFEREYLTKIEPKRYTLGQAFDILIDGIHPASFKAESGLTSFASVEAVRVMRAMMRRNIDKAGGK